MYLLMLKLALELTGLKPMPDARSKGWIYVLIQVIVIGLILVFSCRDINTFEVKSINSIIGITIVVIGLILALLSFIDFGQIVTPNPVPLQNYTLKTAGMYKYIRHPIYSSVLFMLLGVVILSQSMSGLVLWFLGLFFIAFKTRFEEEQLILKFPEYPEYSKRTKKLIPFIY